VRLEEEVPQRRQGAKQKNRSSKSEARISKQILIFKMAKIQNKSPGIRAFEFSPSRIVLNRFVSDFGISDFGICLEGFEC
jgi:hypothetical protein